MGGYKPQFWWKGTKALLLLTVMACSLGAAVPEPKPLRLLQRMPAPQAGTSPTDIRWAGKDSYYLSWFRDGVTQFGLGGKKRRELAPHQTVLKRSLLNYSHLGASADYLLTSGAGWNLAWRPLQLRNDGSFSFQFYKVRTVTDIDLRGDQALVIGHAVTEPEKAMSEAGIAWLATLSMDGIEKLRPVLSSAEIPVRSLYNCQVLSTSASRFLADGSFVVAPGFQDGIHLFDAQGNRVRSWSHDLIGVDVHKTCAKMTREEEFSMGTDADYMQRWLNRNTVIDDILPLEEGPGVLVRSWGRDNKAHWSLKVLRSDGVISYKVPVTSSRPFDRLKGDVRDGRILLLRALAYPPNTADTGSEILLMEVPKS